MQERFWRLLGACERLASDETVALTSRDFVALARIQDSKAAMLAELATEAARMRACRDSTARSRVLKLMECNQANAQLLVEIKGTAEHARRNLRAAFQQLNILRNSYKKQAASGRDAFLAHG